MDAVSGAAAVVALGITGLQSLKFVRDTLDKIRDGPEAVTKLVAATSDLSKVLHQIKSLGESSRTSLQDPKKRLFEELKPMLENYTAELDQAQSKLQRLDSASAHYSWKSMKIFIRERELKKMSKSLNRYTQMLGLKLTSASVTLTLLNQTTLSLSQDTSAQTSRETAARLGSLDENVTSLAGLSGQAREEMSSFLHTERKIRDAAATQQMGELKNVKTEVMRVHRELKKSESSRRLVQDHLESSGAIMGRLEDTVLSGFTAANNASASQQAVMHDLVTMVQNLQTQQKALQKDGKSAISEAVAKESAPEIIASEQDDVDMSIYELLKSISHYQAVDEKDLSYDETQSIIEDLYRLTHLLSKSIQFAKGRCFSCDFTEEKRSEAMEVLERVGSAVTTSRGLQIKNRGFTPPLKRSAVADHSNPFKWRRLSRNQKPNDASFGHRSSDMLLPDPISLNNKTRSTNAVNENFLRNRFPSSFRSTAHPCYASGDVENSVIPEAIQLAQVSGDLTPDQATEEVTDMGFHCWRTSKASYQVQFREHTAPVHDNCPNTAGSDENVPVKTCSKRLVITPARHTGLQFQVILDITQQRINSATTLSIPSLSYRSTIPFGSEVFRIVQYGIVEDLSKLFDGQKASPWDLDPDGRSLLNYAMQAVRPSMVRFLVSSGADVDALEPDSFMFSQVPMGQGLQNDCEELERNQWLLAECQRELLEHGADPTLLVDTGEPDMSCVFSYVYRACSLHSARVILDQGSPFIGPDSVMSNGSSPLLMLSRDIGSGTLDGIFNPDKLMLLMKRGANIHQRDRDGNTALHLVFKRCYSATQETRQLVQDALMLLVTAGAGVYAMNDNDETVSDLAQISGYHEVWVDVLQRCGYDPMSVCSGREESEGWSSAIETLPERPAHYQTPRLSFVEYIATRRLSTSGRIFRFEEEEAAHVRGLLEDDIILMSIHYNWFAHHFGEEEDDRDRDDDLGTDEDLDGSM